MGGFHAHTQHTDMTCHDMQVTGCLSLFVRNVGAGYGCVRSFCCTSTHPFTLTRIHQEELLIYTTTRPLSPVGITHRRACIHTPRTRAWTYTHTKMNARHTSRKVSREKSDRPRPNTHYGSDEC